MDLAFVAQADLSTVPPDHFKWTIVILIGLVLVGLQIWTAVRQNKTVVAPDPLNVQSIDKLATRDFVQERDREYARRLDGHDKEIAALRDDMKEDRRNNEIHASQRSAGIHKKIEDVRSELTDKIDDMPNRIIDQLSKLGLLRKPSDES